MAHVAGLGNMDFLENEEDWQGNDYIENDIYIYNAYKSKQVYVFSYLCILRQGYTWLYLKKQSYT